MYCLTGVRDFFGPALLLRRSALKVTDVTPEGYPAGLDIFEGGIYHLYDYQFFYRNLQENVAVRTEAYLSE